MNKSAQVRRVHSGDRPTRSDSSHITPNLEHKWFEFGLSTVLRQINLIRSGIDENAKELEMVAAAGIFEKSVSDELLRTSRALQVMAGHVSGLRGLVARAGGYLKADKSAPEIRDKKTVVERSRARSHSC